MVKLSDYFNSTTIKGRANVAKATYASFAILYLYHRLTKKTPPQAVKKPDKPAITAPEKDALTKCPKCQCEKSSSTDCNCDKRQLYQAPATSSDQRNQPSLDQKCGDRCQHNESRSSVVNQCEKSDSNNPPKQAVPSHGGKCEQTHHKVMNSAPVKPFETVDVKAKGRDLKFSNEKR
ncbi:uncharacterized protein LOC119644727 [Glossina fuscipes]|uniref:Uncharacterized protein LOC119644727 n=1 Tax=Glossina fuscipes TaxID=7396 RepID=A0A9C5ZP19_9MUSC|nr:uncharacterized protein LOC119644727 [Glossina fuscipes]KAI9588920.1 hypothetical protein GQX74_007089 [Glossina fuscipes]